MDYGRVQQDINYRLRRLKEKNLISEFECEKCGECLENNTDKCLFCNDLTDEELCQKIHDCINNEIPTAETRQGRIPPE